MKVTPGENSCTSAAVAYRKFGFTPIPIPFRSKKPFLDEWEKIRGDEGLKYFNGNLCNLGILLGEPSGGLLDVDCDCSQTVTLAPAILPHTGSVFGRKSRRRAHYLYIGTPLVETTKFFDVRKDPVTGKQVMLVELRSTGAQTIFPPSIHTSGERIEWDQYENPEHIEGAYLLSHVAKLAAAGLLARHWAGEGARHNAAMALAGGLVRGGWAIEDIESFVGYVARVAGDDEWEDRAQAAKDTAENVGKTTGWKTLVRILGTDVVTAVQNWLGMKDQALLAPQNTTKDPTVEQPEIKPEFSSIRELKSAHPNLRQPEIEGLLRQGETMNVISVPKIGKSWLVLDLAIAKATGRCWLNQFQTHAGNVLIMDNELHKNTIASRIPKVAEARGVLLSELDDRLYIESLRGRLRDIYAMDSYFRAIEPGKFSLIILDAFYRFLPRDSDENSNADLASIYNRIDAYAEMLGCCFVCIHHASKGAQGAKSVTDVGAGAGAQSRAVDSHLVLRQHEEDGAVVLDAAVRSWAPVKPTCLRWEFPIWKLAEDLDPEATTEGRPAPSQS